MRGATIISKSLTQGKELVIIRREEFEHLQKRLKETEDALAKIARGERELLEGKTRILHSLAEI